MSMGEEILSALTERGDYSTSMELYAACGSCYNQASFNTTLHDLKRKGTIKRVDLRDSGGTFMYGYPKWKEPAGTPRAEKQEPIAQAELRQRLEAEKNQRLRAAVDAMPIAPRDIPKFPTNPATWCGKPMPQPDPTFMELMRGASKPPEKPMAPPEAREEEIEQEPVLPLIDAIDLGIYRIRGTDLLIQVKQNGVKAYRLGE